MQEHAHIWRLVIRPDKVADLTDIRESWSIYDVLMAGQWLDVMDDSTYLQQLENT